MTLAINAEDACIANLLQRTETIAMVGASDRPGRDSGRVMRFLQDRGYRVIPVNPGLAGRRLHGEPVHGCLAEIETRVDLVDVFRRADAVDSIVDQAIAIGAPALWLQLGVVNDGAAARARAAGLIVVMDRCPAIEIPRLEREAGGAVRR